MLALGLVELERLLVECSALLARDEALEAESLASLHERGGPRLQMLLVSLHSLRVLLLAHDLAVLVLHQIRLMQASGGPRLASPEDGELFANLTDSLGHRHFLGTHSLLY